MDTALTQIFRGGIKMKKISKVISAILSALVVLSCTAGAAQAASGPSIKVISCSGKGCTGINEVLGRLLGGSSDILKNTLGSVKGFCPDGSCNTAQADKRKDKSEPKQNKQTPAQQESGFNSAYEARVLELVNSERKKYGLAPLSSDNGAAKVARLRAREIVKSFSHTRPDGSSCFTAAKEYGVSYRTAGENIAYGYSTPEQVVKGWMNSEGHRKNILSSTYKSIGIGCYKSGNTLYWTQFFIG